MRQFPILFCLATAVFFAALPLATAPKSKTQSFEPEINPAPAAPSSGVAVTVQVAPAAPLPYRFWLEQNYPNPYNATTIIRYSCAVDAYVRLRVYNILGQEVAALVSEQKSAGIHSVLWDSNDKNGMPLASGIYIYRMTAGLFFQAKKLIILR